MKLVKFEGVHPLNNTAAWLQQELFPIRQQCRHCRVVVHIEFMTEVHLAKITRSYWHGYDVDVWTPSYTCLACGRENELKDCPTELERFLTSHPEPEEKRWRIRLPPSHIAIPVLIALYVVGIAFFWAYIVTYT